jgi:hypothetical protein
LGQEISAITQTAQALCNAPLFGIFLLGMLTNRARTKDAIVGYAALISVTSQRNPKQERTLVG